MQPQLQMPGQSMPPVPNVGVAAGMGQWHQTLQPQQQLPPFYQQSVMPQKPVISGPPPRAGEKSCSGFHNASCGKWRTYRTQCTTSTESFSSTAASQYGYTVWTHGASKGEATKYSSSVPEYGTEFERTSGHSVIIIIKW